MMSARMLLFVLFSVVGSLSAQAHPTYTNEPTGSVPHFYCAFNGSLCGMYDQYSSLPDNLGNYGGSGTMASPPGALQMLTEGGVGSGVGAVGFNGKRRDVFFGMTWRHQLYGYGNGTGKLVFVPDPSNSFLVLQGSPGRNCKQLKWYQQERVDNSQATGCGNFGNLCYNTTHDGTGWFEPNVDSSVAEVCWGGEWTKVEVYLRGSTTNTSQDGIIKIWVNGVLSTSYTNVNQGTDLAEFPGGFRYLAFNHAWDGCAGVCAPGGEVWSHFFDDLYISFPVGTPDTIPPSAVTGLTVN